MNPWILSRQKSVLSQYQTFFQMHRLFQKYGLTCQITKFKGRKSPKRKEKSPKLNLNGISNEGTSSNSFRGNKGEGTLSPTARHLLANLSKPQDNKSLIITNCSTSSLGDFRKLKYRLSKQQQRNDVEIEENNSHSYVTRQGYGEKARGLLDAIRKRGGVKGFKKEKQAIAGQGSQETIARNCLKEAARFC